MEQTNSTAASNAPAEPTSLKARIDADMKTAMRARERERLGALRLLMAAIKQKEVDERITLDDAQVLAIIEKLVKQRRDSIEQFEKAGRQELAEQERLELVVLDAYRPAQADEAQIDAVVQAAIQQTGASGMADMGKVMAIVKTQLAGQADLAAVSAKVRARLAG
ncbi:MAG: GatB/YqeY domain-containing protein [Lautropia sp.]|nr:GatB/YqeY domain-containing protein [Lautropia sp.]